MVKLVLRQTLFGDRPWVTERMIESWGAETVVVHGVIYHPAELPGFVVVVEEKIVGLLTYNIQGTTCEIVTLDSWYENQGVGKELIKAVKQAARQNGCKRLWLITTNDNTHALRFYQKRGFAIAAIHVNAVEGSRKIKPEIPLTGNDSIPIRDEIEMEMWL
jgi:ribosomal protein S18 acetylase RimI-like enzyme